MASILDNLTIQEIEQLVMEQEKEILELRASIATLQEMISHISFIKANKEFIHPGPSTVPYKPITPNDWPQKYKVWM